MKKEILAVVKERQPGTSFVEIARAVEGFRGAYAWHMSEGSNIVLWNGLSIEAIEALRALISEKKIDFVAASVMTYMADGEVLTLPLAKKTKYKKPHWLPVAFKFLAD